MYDLVLQPETPVFLAPGAFRKEVRERIGLHGEVLGAARRRRSGAGGRRAGVGRRQSHRGLLPVLVRQPGGTSCDVALIGGGAPLGRAESTIAGYAVRVPTDITTIGSGGGGIAWLDIGGALRVGPQSAGTEPGPACYDRGRKAATVTDASLILGYTDPDYFAAVR